MPEVPNKAADLETNSHQNGTVPGTAELQNLISTLVQQAVKRETRSKRKHCMDEHSESSDPSSSDYETDESEALTDSEDKEGPSINQKVSNYSDSTG